MIGLRPTHALLTAGSIVISGMSAPAMASLAIPDQQQQPQSETQATGTTQPGAVEPQTQTTQDALAQSGDIVVTAQRREQTLSDVPMSVTALSGEQLVNRGVTDIQGLVRVTPGLSFVESGNGVPVYSLRGVGFFESSLGARPTVSVYLDEVSLPFTVMSGGASLDLERVEVLKGPQGTLFGQNATGGAINYIAAKPTKDFRGGATVSFARFNTLDATGFVSGPITSNLTARVAVRGLTGDAWQRSYTRDDTLGRKDFLQGRLLLNWTPLDNLSLTLNVNGFIDKSETQAAQLISVLPVTPRLSGTIPLLINYPLAPRDNRAADWNPGEDYARDNKYYQTSLRADVDLTPDLTLTSLTAYSRMDVDQRVDQDGTTLTNANSDIVGRLSSFTQELRLSGKVGPASFVVGGIYSNDKAIERNLFELPYSTTASALPTGGSVPSILSAVVLATDQRFLTKAAFGSVDYDLSDAFVAHLGVRYTQTELGYSACSRAANAATAATLTAFTNLLRRGTGQPPVVRNVGDCVSLDSNLDPTLLVGVLKEDNVAWRAGLDWKPAPQTLVYANVSRGYKSGSLPTPPALATAAYRPVTQESVVAYEVGFKVPLVRRVLEVTGAAFYYDYTDKQLLGRVFTIPTQLGALQALVNVPKSRIQGVEFQVNAFPVQGLTMSLGGTFLDTKVTAPFVNFTITGVQTDFNGNAFPYTPKYQLVGDVQYEFPFSDDLFGVLGANANYRSETTSGFGAVDALTIDEYALLDLRVGVRRADRRWQVTGFVRNVTDKYYWNNVARLVDTIRRIAGEPRTYGIQVSTRF